MAGGGTNLESALYAGERSVLYILHNILHPAVEDAAKGLNGVGADALIALEAGDLRGADMMLFHEGILRDSLFLHGLPQTGIRHHNPKPRFPLVYYPNLVYHDIYQYRLINKIAVCLRRMLIVAQISSLGEV